MNSSRFPELKEYHKILFTYHYFLLIQYYNNTVNEYNRIVDITDEPDTITDIPYETFEKPDDREIFEQLTTLYDTIDH